MTELLALIALHSAHAQTAPPPAEPARQAAPIATAADPLRLALLREQSRRIHGKGEAAPEDAAPSEYDTRSEAWRMGYDDGKAQARDGLNNLQEDPATQRALSEAAAATGVSLDNLIAMAIIESTGNCDVGTNRSGFTGLMQMGRRSAQDVGIPYEDLQGADNVTNNARAGAEYWLLNDQWLNEEVPRDPLHMYLAHQQGAGGTNALMKLLSETPGKVARRNQRNNLPGRVSRVLSPVTIQDFYDYWTGKMTAIQEAIQERGEVNGKRW